MKIAPVAVWLRAKALIYASWRKFQTTCGHSESGSGKNQPGLLAAVNGAFGAMRQDGSLNQLKKK
jgi:hypothetical protein